MIALLPDEKPEHWMINHHKKKGAILLSPLKDKGRESKVGAMQGDYFL